MSMPDPDAILDAGPTACGELIGLVAGRVRAMQPGQLLRVVGHDPGAWEDIPSWCRVTGHYLVDRAREAEPPARPRALFLIRKREASPP